MGPDNWPGPQSPNTPVPDSGSTRCCHPGRGDVATGSERAAPTHLQPGQGHGWRPAHLGARGRGGTLRLWAAEETRLTVPAPKTPALSPSMPSRDPFTAPLPGPGPSGQVRGQSHGISCVAETSGILHFSCPARLWLVTASAVTRQQGTHVPVGVWLFGGAHLGAQPLGRAQRSPGPGCRNRQGV